MRLTFPVRTLGGSVLPEPDDNPVTLPPTLNAVTLFPGALVTALNAGSSARQTQSHIIHKEVQQGASSGAAAGVISVLSAGLWQVEITIRALADFNVAPIVANQPGVTMVLPPNLSPVFILPFHMSANQVVIAEKDWIWNLPLDGTNINVQYPATGVGQTYDFIVALYAGRIG